ncbi:MAG: phosphate acyltransferase PlsX [Oscillospiraceae bacterium]|nr:phosphate acyltransferase PlsX [Oscillospiraceae bacterium]
MKIIVDAMGGDNAPEEIVKGALNAVEAVGVDVVLVGRGEEILRTLERSGNSNLPNGVEIVDASEVIEIEDDPASAIRLKKDSSITVALTLLRDGKGDALVSAGSTGALLSGATLIVKRVKGIRRAALALFVPNSASGFLLIDCGANAECTPEHLVQFAYMGSFYAESIMQIKSPRVGLLNNGTERTKGTPLQLQVYELLEQACGSGSLNFVGNVEAKDAMKGVCDVLVCDGFTGNVFLKSIEGVASMIMSELKGVFMSSARTKLGALLVKNGLSGLKEKLNPDLVGGTPLLGISKPVIKAHGSSNAFAISNAIRQANVAAKADIAAKLSANISKMKASGRDGE